MNEARELMLRERGGKTLEEVRAMKDPVARAFHAAFMDTGKRPDVDAARRCVLKAAEFALLEGDTETALKILERDMRGDTRDMAKPFIRAAMQLAKKRDTETLGKVLEALPHAIRTSSPHDSAASLQGVWGD